MAYVWLDNINELEGTPATATNMTWDNILSYVNGGSYPASTNSGHLQGGTGIYVLYNDSPYYKEITTTYGLNIRLANYQVSPPGQFRFRNTNDTSYQISWSGNMKTMTFRIAIDYDNQKVQVVMLFDPNSGGSNILCQLRLEDETKKRNWYDFLINHIQPLYNWQSVPSISGKNGILSLVTLDSESINDGEPVSGAAMSVFDQAPSNDNNIKNLADTYGGGEASSAVDVTVKYKVTLPPGGSFSTLKIVAKKDSIPEDVTDGDKIVDISPSKTKKTVTGLDENSLYYFKIFAEDTNSNTSESDEKHITTSGDEGWTFDYTGEIQTFVAPKTGIYQLETWGAQGGDATDGTNSARGGYGAYAYGEVLLNQGDTLYINVGGQNGYGGGGLARKGTRQLTKVKIDGNDVNLITVADKSVYTQSATWGQKIYESNSVPSWLNAIGDDFYTVTEPYLPDNTSATVDKYMSGTVVSARRKTNIGSVHRNAVFLAISGSEINGYSDMQDERQLCFGLLADDDAQKMYFLLLFYDPSPASGAYKYTAWLHNSDASVCSALYDALKYLPDYQ